MKALIGAVALVVIIAIYGFPVALVLGWSRLELTSDGFF